jgi:acetylornithine deacetylase/succinyl-diaminopimelate desuccinylase-like protein
MLTAAEAMKKWAIKLKGDLILCPVMGHKSGGIGTKHHIKSNLSADFCINTETTDLGIITVGVGVVRIHITFKGRPVHFSSIDEKKDQSAFPIQQMAKFITHLGEDVRPIAPDSWLTFETEPDLPGYPQLSVDGIESQYAPENYCKLNMQIRLVPGQSAATVKSDLEQLLSALSKEVPNVEASLQVPPMGGWDFPPYRISKDHILATTLARWHEHVSGKPADIGAGPRLGACGDANFLANNGVPTVQYGPGGIAEYDQWPAINERIRIDDLLIGARTMSLTAAELCGE